MLSNFIRVQRLAANSEADRHALYVAERIGVEHVALGSDFDGATMPADLPDPSRLPELLQALRDGGFSADEVRAIAWENWRRVLGSVWRG